MGDRRSFRARAGMVLNRWVRHLACLAWTSPEPSMVYTEANTQPSLEAQLEELFRAVRHQELIWKTDEWLNRSARRRFRGPGSGRGKSS